MMHGIKNTSNDTFSRLMGNGLRYNVPKYQRDYSWDKEQWSDLWYDVLQMIEDQDSHYMGYLVLQTSDDKKVVLTGCILEVNDETCRMKKKKAQHKSCELNFIWGQNEEYSPGDSL